DADVIQALSLIYGLMLIIIPLYGLIKEEEKTKDLILKSLPIDKRDIVLARYLTVLIYILSISGIIFLSPFLFSFLYDGSIAGKLIPLSVLLYNVVIIMIFMSLFLPIQYLRRKISSVINVIVYLVIALSPKIIRQTYGRVDYFEFIRSIGNIRFFMSPLVYLSVGIG